MTGEHRERAFLHLLMPPSTAMKYIAPSRHEDEDECSILKPLDPNEIPQTTLQLTKNIDKNSKMVSLLTSRLIIKRENREYCMSTGSR